MKELDPNMVTFLLDHSNARAIIYGMMKNAATTQDDPKMVAWYERRKANVAFAEMVAGHKLIDQDNAYWCTQCGRAGSMDSSDLGVLGQPCVALKVGETTDGLP